MKFNDIQQFNNWNEAFMALAPALRQQSIRVADYTKVLFEQACEAVNIGKKFSAKTREQITSRNTEVAYKCGLYHQLGKALLPEEEQVESSRLNEEDRAVYREYTRQGRLLVARLQETAQSGRGIKFRKEKDRRTAENATANITWTMMREACEQHMERYDGTGYPHGLASNNISPIAQIVGLAKELDRLVTTIKSETPFDEAYAALLAQEDSAFSSELLDLLKETKIRCSNIYKKYIYFTNTIPQTIPLVEKRKNRPMGLSYSVLVDATEKVGAVEAKPWFEKKDSVGDLKKIEEQLLRINLVNDMQYYFLYEACDMLLRMGNYRLIKPVIVGIFPSFLNVEAAGKLNQLFTDQPVDKNNLILAVDEQALIAADHDRQSAIKAFLENGVSFMADNWHPEVISFETLNKMGVKSVRPSSDLLGGTENIKLLDAFVANGFNVFAQNSDAGIRKALTSCGAFINAGTNSLLSEDEVMQRLLKEEN